MNEKLINLKELRDVIDEYEGKSGFHHHYENAYQILSVYYLERKLAYRIEDIYSYLADYVYRGIENDAYINEAILDDFKYVRSVLEKNIAPRNEIEQLRLKTIKDWIAQQNGFQNSTEERALHYLCEESDQEKIAYNFDHIHIYVQDWLNGIELAENYLSMAIVDDLFGFMKVFEKLDKSDDIQKLVKLILKYKQGSKEDDQHITKLLEIAIIKSSSKTGKATEEIKKALEEAHSFNVLDKLFKFSNEKKALYFPIFNSGAFLHIEDIQLLTKVCSYLADVYGRENIATKIFNSAILPEFKPKRDGYVQALKALKQPVDLRNVKESEKEFVIDYYIYSLTEDKNFILLLASQNPSLFKKLLSEEVSTAYPSYAYCHRDTLETFLFRQEFFREILKGLETMTYKYLKECTNAVHGTFIDLRPKQKTEVKSDLNIMQPLAFHNEEFKEEKKESSTDTFSFFRNFFTFDNNKEIPPQPPRTVEQSAPTNGSETKSNGLLSKFFGKPKEEELKDMNGKAHTYDDSEDGYGYS